MVGGPHQRRPGADRPGGRRLGAARRGAGRRRDRADLDGRRRHQGRLRPADDARRRRRRRHPRRRQRRRRFAASTCCEVLTEGRADAALAASIFHYNEYGIPATKAYLAERGVPVRSSEFCSSELKGTQNSELQNSELGGLDGHCRRESHYSRRGAHDRRYAAPRAGGQQALPHGHEARGLRPAPQGRPAAHDATARRHPPRSMRRR